MNIYILYNDPFLFGGLEPILEYIKNESNCIAINFQKIYKREIQNNTVLGMKLKKRIANEKIIPDDINNEILCRELLSNAKKNVLIRNYPRTAIQCEMFKDFLKKKEKTMKLSQIWYIEATNVIQNLLKVDKYRIQAESHDPTLSHIKERVIKSKKINLGCLEFMHRFDITEIISIESHGMETKDRYNAIFHKILGNINRKKNSPVSKNETENT